MRWGPPNKIFFNSPRILRKSRFFENFHGNKGISFGKQGKMGHFTISLAWWGVEASFYLHLMGNTKECGGHVKKRMGNSPPGWRKLRFTHKNGHFGRFFMVHTSFQGKSSVLEWGKYLRKSQRKSQRKSLWEEVQRKSLWEVSKGAFLWEGSHCP